MKKIISILTSIVLLSIASAEINAVNNITNPVIAPEINDVGEIGGGAATAIAILLARFFSAALAIGSIMLLIYLVISAFRWLTARDTGTVDTARQGIFNAIIGMIILASVFAIARLVGMILGIQGFPDTIPWPSLE